MADYLYIKSYSKDGDIALSRHVFEDLANDAVERIAGVKIFDKEYSKRRTFNMFNPVRVVFHKNGQVEIVIDITLKKGADKQKVVDAIKEEVELSLLAYTESVPFDININVN